jgi:hypothetical protein
MVKRKGKSRKWKKRSEREKGEKKRNERIQGRGRVGEKTGADRHTNRQNYQCSLHSVEIRAVKTTLIVNPKLIWQNRSPSSNDRLRLITSYTGMKKFD